MPRSSRHKSHKQSKHKEQSDSEEDLRMKFINGKDEFSVGISRDSGLSEKRKVSSGKDTSRHGNGDSMQEYNALKRKREKTDSGAAMDRWNSGGFDNQDIITMDKEVKGASSRGDADRNSRSKVSFDLRSKSTKKHESANENKEKVATVSEKEESRIGSKDDLKRKSEKHQGRKEAQQNKDLKESKVRDKGLAKKGDSKHDLDVQGVVGEVSTKQGSHSIDLNGERQTKRGKEHTDSAIQDDFRNPELEKELEKRIRRSDSSREKHKDDVKDSESRRVSSKSDHAKNGRHKDEKNKDGSHGDKRLEDGDKEGRYKEDRYHEDHERDKRNKDGKHGEDGERVQRHRDSKYREDVDRDSRHKADKYRDSGHRDSRNEDTNHFEEGDKGRKRREDKYLEDDNADNRYRDDKHHESSNGKSKGNDEKYHEDRRRDDRYREARHREDIDKDIKHREGKQGDNNDKTKRLRDIKYQDEHLQEGISDKSDVKRARNGSDEFERHKKSTNQDVYDHNTQDKDDKERRRGADKDYSDGRSINTKDQTSEADKKYISGARLDAVGDQGKSSSRYTDKESSPSRSRRYPSTSSAATKVQSRASIQDEVYHKNMLSSKKEFGGSVEHVSSSRSNERSRNKDDLHYQELSVERRQKLDSRSSPLHLADKSPSSASTERRHFSRSDARKSLDIDDSGHRSGGSRDAKEYPNKDGRGSRDPTMEPFPGNDDTLSVSSPFTRSNSHIPHFPPPSFRNGSDSHSVIGSMEEDSRGKYYNRPHRRVGDSSMARGPPQGNAWKGIQNWPSPVTNGFMPFPHGPPAPVGFHPMMQQFPGPPIFGIRPPMDLNHSGYGRPPLHGWDGNNTVYRDESHMYGRLGWDQNMSISGVQSWDTHQDAWKANVEIPQRVDEDEENNIHEPSDEVSAAKLPEQVENDESLKNVKAMDIVDVTQPYTVEDENTPTPKTSSEEMQKKQMEITKKDDISRTMSYLSKLEISVNLAVPDLFHCCMNFKDDKDEKTNSDEDVSELLFLKSSRRNRNKSCELTSKSLPIPATNESIFQKAMSLYGNQTEEWMKVLQPNNNMNALKIANAEEDKPRPADAQEAKVGSISSASSSPMDVEDEEAIETGMDIDDEVADDDNHEERDHVRVEGKCGNSLILSDVVVAAEVAPSVNLTSVRIHQSSDESTH